MTLASRVCIVTLCALVYMPVARAQSAEAEALFRDGRTLIKQGKVAAGCDKLAGSERLEASVGTLLNLGDCREKLGQVATAWAAFREAEALAKRTGGDDKRRVEAARRAEKLEPRLPMLVIDVPRRVPDLVVRRGDAIVDPAMWSTPIPVDPGRYTITAEAPGYIAWHGTVEVAAAAKRNAVAVPALEHVPVPKEHLAAAPPPPPSSVVQPAPLTTVPAVDIVRHNDPGTWTTTRGVSLALGIAGAGALGVGVYFGLQSKDLQDRADQRCPLTVCTDPDGLQLNKDAQTAATRANMLYVAGGASVAASIILWIVGAPVQPQVSDRAVTVSYAGRF